MVTCQCQLDQRASRLSGAELEPRLRPLRCRVAARSHRIEPRRPPSRSRGRAARADPAWAVHRRARARGAHPPVRGQRDLLRAGDLLLRLPRGGAGAWSKETSASAQFLFSTQWYPTSAPQRALRDLALTVGTLSVTALAMVIAVPFGLGAAIFFRSSAARGCRETLKIVIELLAAIPSVVWGFIGLTVMSRLIVCDHRRARRRQRAQWRNHSRADERADHRLHRRGRAQGGARLLPRGGHRARRDALASSCTACCCRRRATACSPRCCWASAAPSVRRWRC